MATNTPTTVDSTTSQPIGHVAVLYGTVTAVAPDGSARTLSPNSPIFAEERIVTGGDGSVSIIFDDPAHTQLDLGRMSEVTLDEDVFAGEAPVDTGDVATDVTQIQEAILAGDFDPTTGLEAPAAGVGGPASAGGGHPVVLFDLINPEVTPDSGAPTTGIAGGFLDPVAGIEDVAPEPTPAFPTAIPTASPTASPDIGVTPEGNNVIEGSESPISGNITLNDDSGDGAIYVTSIVIGGTAYSVPGTYPTPLGGELTVNSDGSYSYVAPSDVDHDVNNDGVEDTVQEVFPYTITNSEGNSASSTLTITIADTAPTAHPDVNAVTEDSEVNQEASGNVITGTPPETGADELRADSAEVIQFHSNATAETGAAGQTIAGAYGQLTIDADGHYTYTLDNGSPDVQALGDEETAFDTFTYTLEDIDGDKSTTSLTITINGTNDGPVAVNDQNAIAEGVLLNVAASGVLNDLDPGEQIDDHDVDTNDTLTVTGVAQTEGGTYTDIAADESQNIALASGADVTLHSDGSYTYDQNGVFDSLSEGQTTTDSFAYRISDGHGGTDTATVTITINGTNDGPVAVNDQNAVAEGVLLNVAASGVLNDLDPGEQIDDHDVDTNDTLTVTGVAQTEGGTYTDIAADGSQNIALASGADVTLHSDGSYTYDQNGVFDSLSEEQTTTDSFAYRISDGHGGTDTATVTITINGANDAPVVGNTAMTVSEEGLDGANPDALPNATLDTTDLAVRTGSIAISDVDTNDTLAVTFGAPSAVLTSNEQTIVWDTSVAGSLIGKVGATAIITVSMQTDTEGNYVTNASGEYLYTVTLAGQVDHDNTTIEDVLSFDVPVYVSDGIATSTGTMSITVEDDSPTIDPQDAILANESGNEVTGDLNVEVGGDSAGASYSLNLVEGSDVLAVGGTTHLTSDGVALVWHDNGDGSWSAMTDAADPDTDVFSLSMDTSTGTYTVALDGDLPLDGAAGSFELVLGSGVSGGNTLDVALFDLPTKHMTDTTPADNVPDGSAHMLYVTAYDEAGVQDTVNASVQGLGVGKAQDIANGDDASAATSEELHLWFALPEDPTGVTDPTTDLTLEPINHVVLTLDGLNSGETATWNAYLGATWVTGGSVAGTGTGSSSASDDSFTIDTGSAYFNNLVLTAADGSSYRVTAVTGITTDAGSDYTISVPVSVTDGDDDSASTAFNVTFDADGTVGGTDNAEAISGSDQSDLIHGHGGDDAIFGNDGADILYGDAGHDHMEGGAGDDHLFGGDGSDTLMGGVGNDFIVGGAGADHIDGGAGIDTLSYADDSAGVDVNLETGAVSGAGDADGDTMEIGSIENLIGSEYADHLVGDAQNNVIEGGDGADSLEGGDGTDTLSYASDTVGVTVDLSTDSASGVGSHAEGDTISGFENVTGGSGDDHLTGDDHVNILVGGDGDDILVGNGGDDILTGGQGADEMTGGDGADRFVYHDVSEGGDTIHGYTHGEDVLNLTDVLGEADIDMGNGPNHNNNNVGDFIHLETSGTDTTVSVDVDGAVNGENFVEIATLEGFDATGTEPVDLVADGTIDISTLLDDGTSN